MTHYEADQTVQGAFALIRAGRPLDAAQLFRKVIADHPQHAHALNGLGTIALAAGELEQAAAQFAKAAAADPANPGFHMNLGTALMKQRMFAEAEQAYRKALQLSPNDANAKSNLAIVLAQLGRLDEAIASAHQAIAINPAMIGAHTNLASFLKQKGLYAEAVQAYKAGLDLAPNHSGLLSEYATYLGRAGRFEEALEAHQRAIRQAPSSSQVYMNLGFLLQGEIRMPEAIDAYRKATQLAPGDALAHLNLAVGLLMDGQWEEGLREYEWRLKYRDYYAATFVPNRWDGSDPAGKTLLIRCEQGIGDSCNFIRYAQPMAQGGARVIVEAHAPSARLISSAPGVAQVFVQGETPPPFDYEIPIASLPLIAQARPDRIFAPIPYLQTDAERVESWAQRLKQYPAKLKVGIVWGGSEQNPRDASRSMKLADFALLAGVEGVRLFALQKGMAAMQVFSAPPEMQIVDFAPFLNSFDDTAAALENLDLLISVDTSVAHLAGALGRPVWTLLERAPDWRWLLNRSDTPWYPTMKLFRQPRTGDWEAVIGEVVKQLREFKR